MKVYNKILVLYRLVQNSKISDVALAKVEKVKIWVTTKIKQKTSQPMLMEQHSLKNVNNCLNANIYSYLETSGGQSSNLFLNGVHFFNTSVN